MRSSGAGCGLHVGLTEEKRISSAAITKLAEARRLQDCQALAELVVASGVLASRASRTHRRSWGGGDGRTAMRKMALLAALTVAFGVSMSAQQSASFYDLRTVTLDGKPADLSQYRGKVSLVVNVASKCG